ncbi:SRPBCC family protein [Aquimarina hainanensis]|uniref:SRPBCC family protein n=1 Tax=Aquimarina hainanensis TaxID=1578017 RepID=A0ABW5N781_9FLAO
MIPIFILLIVLVIGYALYQARSLQHIRITRTVQIHGDMQTVFDQVVYLKNFKKWSPFLEADPSQKIQITGEDGNVGAQYHWIGNNGKDVGYQEIKDIQPLHYIKMGCEIQKPFVSSPLFEYSFSQEGTTTKVTQNFTLKSGFVDAFFMWIFGVKKDMIKMNTRGMELLKKVVEANK